MSMSIKPLYDSLKKDIELYDLTTEQKEELVTNIKLLDEKGSELIFVLIKLFAMDINADTTSKELPFDAKFISKEYRFDLEKFPISLKHILYKFTNMHVKNMEEENQINLERKTLNV